MSKIMKSTTAALALCAALTVGAPAAFAATDLPLPAATAAALAAPGTTAEDVARLSMASIRAGNGSLVPSIIAAAIANGFDVLDIVEAAFQLRASVDWISVAQAAAEAAPNSADEIAFTLASAAGLVPGEGGDGDESDAGSEISRAKAIAYATVRGSEAALGAGTQEAADAAIAIGAELAAFLGPDKQLTLAQEIADATAADDLAADILADIQTAAIGDDTGLGGDGEANVNRPGLSGGGGGASPS